jgi:hypothetical protein
MHTAIVRRQIGPLLRVLLRDRLVLRDVTERGLEAFGDGWKKRRLPETNLGLLNPDNVFGTDRHKTATDSRKLSRKGAKAQRHISLEEHKHEVSKF